ncbi:DUF4302 domain-containing protein [Niastella caeni]|uniref:DUF4302 domain-containing protein n=1 Tax=Niastella caeni TaxID=2569763 RepID=A0A4S8HWZ2_9BACT|nr:DUF4302 domain-containing protein [Niastella caeni]THU39279.1 DUF4302 domain-containing protein [Niastella caeni]
MKKLFIYTVAAIIGFYGCNKKSDDAFDKSPDERLNETLATYQSALVGAQYGWKGLIYPAGLDGGVVGFYFKFNEGNRVEMFSDFNAASAVTPMTASYRLKALQQPALLFDTYSYVHVLADPDRAVNGGNYGDGLKSDFEFAIDGISGDTVKLTGRFNGSKAILVKATQQEAQNYYDKKYANRLFSNISNYITYFKRLVVGSTQYEIKVNQSTRTITFTWVDGNGNVHTFTTGYYYTADGIALSPAFNDGSTTISAFNNIAWNGSTTTMTFTVNGTSSSIIGSGQPIKVDLDAPRRWWQYAIDQDGYWISLQGFHVNGVDDAYGVTRTTNFYFMLYWPQYGTSGGIAYDVVGNVKLVNNSLTLPYGLGYRPPNFTTDGRISFPYLGSLGTVTAADSVAVARTRIQFAETSGYYLVRTDSTTYDMVSAKDGKAWITWEYPD